MFHLEHVIDGGEHRGGDREQRAAMRKNCAWRSVFLFDRCPGAMHRGLEQDRALAHAIGSTLASTLFVARAETSPGDEMCGRRDRFMLTPISETITCALRLLIPVIDMIKATAV